MNVDHLQSSAPTLLSQVRNARHQLEQLQGQMSVERDENFALYQGRHGVDTAAKDEVGEVARTLREVEATLETVLQEAPEPKPSSQMSTNLTYGPHEVIPGTFVADTSQTAHTPVNEYNRVDLRGRPVDEDRKDERDDRDPDDESRAADAQADLDRDGAETPPLGMEEPGVQYNVDDQIADNAQNTAGSPGVKEAQ